MGTSDVSMKMSYRKVYPYVEESGRFWQPLRRGRLDNDCDPQVCYEFDGVGGYIGWALGQFCGHVSFVETAEGTGICERTL
jgi:hypothetical protein